MTSRRTVSNCPLATAENGSCIPDTRPGILAIRTCGVAGKVRFAEEELVEIGALQGRNALMIPCADKAFGAAEARCGSVTFFAR